MQNKNLNSISKAGCASLPSVIPSLECVAESDIVGYAQKDNYGNINCPEDMDNRKNQYQTAICNEQRSFMGAESYNKASDFKIFQETSCSTCKNRQTYCLQNELGYNGNSFYCRWESPMTSNTFDRKKFSFASEVGVTNVPPIQSSNSKRGAHMAENASASSIQSSKAIPSFEFCVSSEEGINIIVDLNSSPLDWSKRLDSEVSGCHNMLDNKFGSLREELQLLRSSNKQIENPIWNTDSEHKMNNDHVQAESSSYSTKKECNPVVIDHQYRGDVSLRSSTVKQCHVAVEMSTQLEENNEFLLFSTPNSDVRNDVTSGTESCPIDRETIPLESGVNNIPQIKSSSNSVVNSTSEGPKDLDLFEHMNSVVGDKNCEDITLQNTCNDVSPSLANPGSSSASMEMQLAEVASQQKDASCSPCRNSGFLDVVDPMVNLEARDDELANSSTSQSHMSPCAEEWERSKVINAAESSESLQLTKALEKTPETSEADKIPKRKRQHSEGIDLNLCGVHHARILRSNKHLLERVLPRRSMRLAPK
ncbi:hypothetical protein U1Q18_030446 [Sarracenia purpurea var. burkii]